MEVHHHGHHGHDKKKLKNYFYDFLMLFLAVFCGFLAEYQLEHLIENQREKKLISSFVEDIKTDTALVSVYEKLNNEKIKQMDSLIWYLNSPDYNKHSQRIYFFGRQLTRRYAFYSSDGTIKQLKNSGGFRLIKNKNAIDSIISYDQAMQRILLSQDVQTSELEYIKPMIGKLLNANVLETMVFKDIITPPQGNPPLRKVSEDFILDFIYSIHQMKGSLVLNTSSLNQLKEKGTKIIVSIKNEYHIE